MTILNPSFETPGTLPGTAESWSEGYSATSEDIAGFDHTDGYTRPWDDFACLWQDNQLYQLAFSITDIVASFFCSLSIPRENFESGWKIPAVPSDTYKNDASLFAFNPDWFTVALFDTVDDPVEDFEEDWGLTPFCQAAIFTYASGTFVRCPITALFILFGYNIEGFESWWQSNELAAYVFGGVNLCYFTDNLSPPINYYIAETFDYWTTTLP